MLRYLGIQIEGGIVEIRLTFPKTFERIHEHVLKSLGFPMGVFFELDLSLKWISSSLIG